MISLRSMQSEVIADLEHLSSVIEVNAPGFPSDFIITLRRVMAEGSTSGEAVPSSPAPQPLLCSDQETGTPLDKGDSSNSLNDKGASAIISGALKASPPEIQDKALPTDGSAHQTRSHSRSTRIKDVADDTTNSLSLGLQPASQVSEPSTVSAELSIGPTPVQTNETPLVGGGGRGLDDRSKTAMSIQPSNAHGRLSASVKKEAPTVRDVTETTGKGGSDTKMNVWEVGSPPSKVGDGASILSHHTLAERSPTTAQSPPLDDFLKSPGPRAYGKVVPTGEVMTVPKDVPQGQMDLHAIAATPGTLEIGVANETHGWLRVRAELGMGGTISASLVAADQKGAETLRLQLPALSSYLSGEHLGLTSLMVTAAGPVAQLVATAAPQGFLTALSGGRSDGSSQGQREDRGERPALMTSELENETNEISWLRQAMPSRSLRGSSGGWLSILA